MGTRDDEYDYLFKGAVCGTETGEGTAGRQQAGGLRLRSGPLGPGRSPGLGGRRVRQRGRPGQFGLGQLRAGVRGRAERTAQRGLGALDAPRRGRGPEGVGPQAVGEAVRGGAFGGGAS